MNASQVPEEQLLEWLAPCSPARRALLAGLGLERNAQVRTGVQEPLVRAGHLPGDIDIVAWHSTAPERGYALEAKRLKVSENTFLTGNISGAGKLAHAERQVRGLSTLGFHCVGLLVFLLVDVHTVAPGQWLASAPAPVHRDIRERLAALECSTLVIEVNQPTKRHVFSAGTVGHYWISDPKRSIQQSRVTSVLQEGAL